MCNPLPAFPDVILRGKGHVKTLFSAQCADNPFGNHQMVGSLDCRHGEEFYLILLVDLTVYGEVPHLVVAVFDLTSGLSYQVHALYPEVVKLGKRCRFMISLLIRGMEKSRVF